MNTSLTTEELKHLTNGEKYQKRWHFNPNRIYVQQSIVMRLGISWKEACQIVDDVLKR